MREESSQDFAEAFDNAVIGLRATVEAACEQGGSWPGKVVSVVYAVLEFVAIEPRAARILTVDSLSYGPYGIERRRRLIECFARLLASGRGHRQLEGELPPLTEEILIGGIAWMVTRELEAGAVAGLDDLFPELVEVLLLPYLGSARAKRWGRCSASALAEIRSRGGR